MKRVQEDEAEAYLGMVLDGPTPAPTSQPKKVPATKKRAGKPASRFKLMNRFWRHPMTPGLSHAAQAVWCYLWSLADGRGRCYPSQRRIADRLGCSRCYAKQIVARLRECGYLTVVSRGTSKGQNRANVYQIRLPQGQTDGEL